MMRTILLTVVVVILVALAPITGVAAIQETNTGPADQTATDESLLAGYGPAEEPDAGENTVPSSSPDTATAPGDDWSLLIEDTVEDPAKIETVYTQRTDETVYFKVEYANITTHDSFDLGIFIDADQSVNTGLNSSLDLYNMNDIGADYVAVVGWEGDALWNWDDQNQTWPYEDEEKMDLAYKDIQYTQDTVIVGVDREQIDNPDAIDLVFGEAREEPWDYVPDEGEGHVTLELSGSSDSDDEPTAAFNYEPELPTVEDPVTFNASEATDDGEITSYEWDFDGDGMAEATGVTATHAFDSAGEHNVTLTVTDDAEQTDTTTQTVQVVQSDGPTVYLEPVNGTVSVNGTTTYTLKMSNVDGGVGAFDPLNVTLEEPATVSIQEVSTPFSGASTTRSSDGTQASVTLPFGGETADTGTVELATLTIRGEMPGKTAAQVTVAGDIARENGSLYENVSSIDSEIHTRPSLPPVVGEDAPTDADDDGKLEDVNGNGDFDIGDIQALFANRDSDAVRNNADQFDFNDNGGIDIGDIQALFQEYMN